MYFVICNCRGSSNIDFVLSIPFEMYFLIFGLKAVRESHVAYFEIFRHAGSILLSSRFNAFGMQQGKTVKCN